MNLVPQSTDRNDYLADDETLRLDDPHIRRSAEGLFAGCSSEEERILAAFIFVRDRIHHSADIGSRRVTRSAPEVLALGEGICYAKTMLLAALVRSAGIPAGYCYQRLTLDDADASRGHCIHAVNAVFLPGHGAWVRLDARGNTNGRNAQFHAADPLREQLAFPVRPHLGEISYPDILAAHHPVILETLRAHTDCRDMLAHLPGTLT